MTVDSQNNKISYAPDGIEDTFAYDFRVDEASDMVVYADDEVYAGGYSVTDLTNPDGGDVIFDIAPSADIDSLTLIREVPLTQGTAYPPLGPFPAKSHEAALDKLTFIAQQQEEALSRAAIAPIDTDPATDYTLPAYASGEVWLWDLVSQRIITSALVVVIGDDGTVIANTMVALRSVTPSAGNDRAILRGYWDLGDGGGGPERYGVYGAAPGTYVDNGGSITVPNGGDGSAAWLWDASSVNTTDKMWGITGTTGETTKLQTAIDNTAGVLNVTTYGLVLESQVEVRDPCTGIKGCGPVDTGFIKGFNGDALKVTNQGSTLKGFRIDGDGANFTGGGVYTVPDDCDFDHLRITDTEDACLIYEHNNSTYCSASHCHLACTDPLTYSIRTTGIDLSGSPTVRTFDDIHGGGSIIDFSGMNRAVLTNSFGTRVKFDINCSKITVTNNRFTNTVSDVEILGLSHIINNNNWGFGSSAQNVIIGVAPTTSDVSWGDCNAIVQGSTTKIPPVILTPIGGVMVNNISSPVINYDADFEWMGATTDGVFGNSTYTANYILSGRKCQMTFSFVRGSTATIPTGSWSFTIPFKSAPFSSVGELLIKTSTGSYRTATMKVFGNGLEVFLYVEGGTGEVDESTFTFGTNGTIDGTFEYTLASS